MTADIPVADLLHRLPYFAQLPPGRLRALAQQATHHIFEAGQSVFVEGEPSAGLWIIERGRVKVFRLNLEGREHILHFAGPGDSFNDIAAIDGRSYPANCIALSETRAWLLPHDILVIELRRDPEFASVVIDVLANRVRVLVQRVEDLALHSATARLAGFLLLQSKNPSLKGPGITRAVIAARLATTPETVSRALRELEDKGAIQFDRHRIVIVAPDLLQEISLK
jgi:CRP-like cAMP-binding protein